MEGRGKLGIFQKAYQTSLIRLRGCGNGNAVKHGGKVGIAANPPTELVTASSYGTQSKASYLARWAIPLFQHVAKWEAVQFLLGYGFQVFTADLLSINQSIQGALTWLIGYFEPFGLNRLIDGLEFSDWLKLDWLIALMIAVLIYVKLRPSSPVSPVE